MKCNKKVRAYSILGLLLLIFVGPIITAVIIYAQRPHWLSQNTVNKGELISPPLNFNALKKQNISRLKQPRHWQIVYLTKTDCEQPCQQRLHRLAKVILALGKNNKQISATLIQVNSALPLNLTSTNHYLITHHEYQRMFTSKKLSEGYYLVAPQGEVILHYPVNASSEAIYKDMHRLLANSN
jgi:cytochrome oxidase Cu insertion factor (SCO1/SenC/PrrC family)